MLHFKGWDLRAECFDFVIILRKHQGYPSINFPGFFCLPEDKISYGFILDANRARWCDWLPLFTFSHQKYSVWSFGSIVLQRLCLANDSLAVHSQWEPRAHLALCLSLLLYLLPFILPGFPTPSTASLNSNRVRGLDLKSRCSHPVLCWSLGTFSSMGAFLISWFWLSRTFDD